MSDTPALKDSQLKQLCSCGKTSVNEFQRISRGLLIKAFLFWLPLKRYKCFKCRRTMLVMYRPLLRGA